MKKKIVFLHDNMIDENEKVIFEADIPYEVDGKYIENENGIVISINDIWVDFHLVHQTK